MNDGIDALVARLEGAEELLRTRECLIGFDGYVDTIVRVVKSSPSFDDPVFFETIAEFAEHIRAASGKSVDMRIISQDTRVGGNGPIMASALSLLGAKVTCVGALGEGELNPVFTQGLPPACKAIGIIEPGYTEAFEFDDGKLMFGNISGFDKISWEAIKRRIGLGALEEMVRSSDLIGVMNWSALHGTESILKGLLEEVFPSIDASTLSRKYAVIDLADPSARSRLDIAGLFAALRRLAGSMRVALCLNEKEARILCGALGAASADLRHVCETIYRELSPDIVQIHALKTAVGMDASGFGSIEGVFVEKPTITTGGGDNFNAGFALGLLLECPLKDCLVLGNAAAALYVMSGTSPTSAGLLRFIKDRAGQGDYS